MKYKSVIIGIISLIVIVSCDNLSDINYNQEYVIPVTKTVKTSDKKYVIRFDSVFTDSRCPSDVVCVWAGIGGAKFTILDKDSSSQTFKLYTDTNSELKWSDSAMYKDIKIKLLKLTPYPSTANPIKYEDYKAKIIITKID